MGGPPPDEPDEARGDEERATREVHGALMVHRPLYVRPELAAIYVTTLQPIPTSLFHGPMHRW
eukprot:CAMPEP_0119470668 /NCGR_PEP_ID=MMETSP1344-20130328/3471_1 /TAXON_ID=236787 /ORGANISM="Florenciella parvula, Strain CCMP2471" /LENGTH=62 /DNA_ID=CAMNT_0007503371 /DNA_START=195 /DNA_END=380 /DNA_ORIENTATION=+